LTRSLLVSAFLLSIAGSSVAQPAGPFKIVVLAGEESVNVIQQKTAVAPLIEVRDRNNVPVPGAMVTFAVQGGKAAAFQGGASSLTIATNAAGQAAATGFTPMTAGAVNISVQATVQGQVVTAAISQVNVMTAAEAAAAASGAGAGGGAGSSAGAGAGTGGGAAGGGGLSATTLGIVGGAVAAGAVVATQALGDEGKTVFSGQFSMNVTLQFGGCARQENYSGQLELQLDSISGSISGNAEIMDASGAVTATTCTGPIGVGPIGSGRWGMPNGPVSGTESSMLFQVSDVVPSLDGNGITIARSFKFTGALSGSTITGQIEMSWRNSQPNFPPMDMKTTVTLQKQ
jgi:hypothetical protein